MYIVGDFEVPLFTILNRESYIRLFQVCRASQCTEGFCNYVGTASVYTSCIKGLWAYPITVQGPTNFVFIYIYK